MPGLDWPVTSDRAITRQVTSRRGRWSCTCRHHRFEASVSRVARPNCTVIVNTQQTTARRGEPTALTCSCVPVQAPTGHDRDAASVRGRRRRWLAAYRRPSREAGALGVEVLERLSLPPSTVVVEADVELGDPFVLLLLVGCANHCTGSIPAFVEQDTSPA